MVYISKPPTISAGELAEALDHLKRSVEAIVKIEKPVAIIPIVRAACLNTNDQNSLALIGLKCDFNSDENKDKAMLSVALTLLERGLIPRVVALVSEAWHVRRVVSDPGLLPRRPSDCPDRQEIVSIQVLGCDKQAIGSIAVINRNDQDQIISLGPFEDLDGEVHSNLLAKVFGYYAALVTRLSKNAQS